MTKDFSVLINLFAQDKIGLEIILREFDEMSLDDKRGQLYGLRIFIEQSHPTIDIINQAIQNMPIKSTVTPLVILRTNNFKEALLKICD